MNVTTIVAIVALVSFLIICVVLISSWRRGVKARNASIKAIEQSISDVVYELAEMNTTWKNTYERIDFEKKREEENKATEKVTEIEKIIEKEQEPLDVLPQGEISLDFSIFEEFEDMSLDDLELTDDMSDIKTDYNTGRSGRRYTAEELETLIKE